MIPPFLRAMLREAGSRTTHGVVMRFIGEGFKTLANKMKTSGKAEVTENEKEKED